MKFHSTVFLYVLLVLLIGALECHHHQPEQLQEQHNRRHSRYREVAEEINKGSVPFSPKRLEKMLEKAILKIIIGNLSPADMLLLQSLNYSMEEVLAIRERELTKLQDEKLIRERSASPEEPTTKVKKHVKHVTEGPPTVAKTEEFDFDSYNRQAALDYERMDSQQPWQEPTDSTEQQQRQETNVESLQDNQEHREFDRAMEPHVVFKIRYDDSEFDSGSEESKALMQARRRHSASNRAPKRHQEPKDKSFLDSAGASVFTPMPLVYKLQREDLTRSSSRTESYEVDNNSIGQRENSTEAFEVEVDNKTESSSSSSGRRSSEYEGLEWIEDDVYRVIPGAVDMGNYDSSRDETYSSEYEDEGINTIDEARNDTVGYQDDPTEENRVSGNTHHSLGNLSAMQQLAMAHRREGNSSYDSQGQKAIEDIKMRVLALTGRFNSTNTNQVQREKLSMFSPSCQMPRNTDAELWSDPSSSMNMHFQLNLTSSDHVVAAKLRIFKLPQENFTLPDSTTWEEDDEEEKKIRISVYFYTKSLKKHRVKKRLMDSVVTPLSPTGGHLALDVRQALRFWRLTPRSPHSNSNHGLVIQVEDQDGRPLKPAQFIQPHSCSQSDENNDNKSNASLQFSSEPVLVTFAS